MKKIIITIILLIAGLGATYAATVSHLASQVTPGQFASGEYSMQTLKITSGLNMTDNKITDLATPTVDSDAATKAYVDASGGSAQITSVLGTCYNGPNTQCTISLQCPENYVLFIAGCGQSSSSSASANSIAVTTITGSNSGACASKVFDILGTRNNLTWTTSSTAYEYGAMILQCVAE